jgi:hypothetical protein
MIKCLALGNEIQVGKVLLITLSFCTTTLARSQVPLPATIPRQFVRRIERSVRRLKFVVAAIVQSVAQQEFVEQDSICFAGVGMLNYVLNDKFCIPISGVQSICWEAYLWHATDLCRPVHFGVSQIYFLGWWDSMASH